MPGPRTRSRANAVADTVNEPAHYSSATETEQRKSVEREEPSSFVIKPTFSKVLKESSNVEASGSMAAYLALRERQKKNIASPTIEDLTELNLNNIAADEVKKGNVYVTYPCSVKICVKSSMTLILAFFYSCS